MKTLWFKDYLIMLERQHNGSVRAVASSDHDRIRCVFYDYPMSYIVQQMKSHIRYRLANGICEA